MTFNFKSGEATRKSTKLAYFSWFDSFPLQFCVIWEENEIKMDCF